MEANVLAPNNLDFAFSVVVGEINGIEDLEMGSATSAASMLYGNDNRRTLDISSWDMSNISNISGFMNQADGLQSSGTGGYDHFIAQLRSKHEAGNLADSLSINMGGSQFSAAAVSDYYYMTNSVPTGAGWTIIDGGLE